jgi:FkbM family methyltransferase
MAPRSDTTQPALSRLRRFLAPAVLDAFDLAVAQATRQSPAELWPNVIAAITERNDLLLSRRWRFASRRVLDVLIEEILCAQEYFAETADAEPRIIDAGANFGLATYFFRRCYPGARIEAFEPNPALADILQLNLDRNDWNDAVSLRRVAISDRDGETSFFTSTQEDAASSLIATRAPSDALEIRVPTVDIRSLLQRPVTLLKIDVEGAEAAIFRAAGQQLRACETIIGETHSIEGSNTLLPVLTALDDAGFAWSVARSVWDERSDRLHLARHVHKRQSYAFFARRKD